MTTIHLHTKHNAGPVDPRIFGGFLEHLGRAVYGGVYDPGNRRSDADGFRQDVLEAIRPMRMPVVRYQDGDHRDMVLRSAIFGSLMAPISA